MLTTIRTKMSNKNWILIHGRRRFTPKYIYPQNGFSREMFSAALDFRAVLVARSPNFADFHTFPLRTWICSPFPAVLTKNAISKKFYCQTFTNKQKCPVNLLRSWITPSSKNKKIRNAFSCKVQPHKFVDVKNNFDVNVKHSWPSSQVLFLYRVTGAGARAHAGARARWS